MSIKPPSPEPEKQRLETSAALTEKRTAPDLGTLSVNATFTDKGFKGNAVSESEFGKITIKGSVTERGAKATIKADDIDVAKTLQSLKTKNRETLKSLLPGSPSPQQETTRSR